MNQPVLPFVRSILLVLFFALATSALAQQPAAAPAESSYEAVLQVIVGSNESVPGIELPKNLSSVSRQLHDNFGFSSFRLSNTILSRSTSRGHIEYKSVSDNLGQAVANVPPTFLEWSLGLRADGNSQNAVQINPFRFGAQIPITTAKVTNAEGRTSDITNYQSVGLTTERMALPLGRPSLVGTVSLPGSSGTLFLVLTVRPVND